MLRRDEMRQLALSSPIPAPINATYDMRDPTAMTLDCDALSTLVDRDEGIARVIGNPVRDGGLLIEVTMDEMPLRAAMIDYGLNVLALSAVISVITAFLLFLAVQGLSGAADQARCWAYAKLREITRRCAADHYALCRRD